MSETAQSPYRDILSARVQSAIAMAKAVKDIEHAPTLGESREVLVRELFRPLLPPNIGVGTGIIIDHEGRQSHQTDIILFDRSLAPSITLNESGGLFPIESCLYAIEIKSTLCRGELQASHDNALKLQQFSYSNQKEGYRVAQSLLFAFGSDLVNEGKYDSECSRYQDIYKKDSRCLKWDSETPLPPIRAMCIVGKEYGHEDHAKWLGPKSDEKGGEVLWFIGGILNMYRSIATTRQPPYMEHYVIPENSDFEWRSKNCGVFKV